MQASAVIVTKGDVDLGPVLASLRPHFEDIVVWDNSERINLKVCGRYAAVKEAKHRVIYTQDDDAVVNVAEVLKQYQAGYVTCNMPAEKQREYEVLAPHVALVGWGACFDQEHAQVLDRYIAKYGADELFLRECDRVFTSLNARKLIDVPFRHLPSAHFANRMGNQRSHLADLAEIQKRIATL